MTRILLLMVGVLSLLPGYLKSQGALQWKLGPTLSQPRAFHNAVLINDSTAIVMGGWRTIAFGKATNTCDFVEATQQGIIVRTAPSMTEARAEFPAYRMGDSAIIVFGGVTIADDVLKEVEIYDIATDRWRTVGMLLEGRRQHVAYPIGDSKFLIVGGRSKDLSTLSSAEIFDVATGTSTVVTKYPVAINGSIGMVTSNGTGIILGGRSGGANSSRSSAIRTYDTSTKTWKMIDDLSFGREAPMSLRLRDGRAVIVGGAEREGNPYIFSKEVVLENNDQFSVPATLEKGLIYCGVAEYHDGQVVVAGGQDESIDPISGTSIVDLGNGKVTRGPDLNVARYRNRGISLAYSGSKSDIKRTVVVIGGVGTDGNALSSIEYLDGECVSSSGYDLLASSSMLTAVGTARLSQQGNAALLTNTTAFSSGAIWYRGKFAMGPGLSTSFSFRLSSGNDNAQIDGGPQGADGIALVIQNSSAAPLGEAGEGIGYEGIVNAIAVEFDAYLNAAYSDPSGSHIAVQTAKDSPIHPWHLSPYLLGMTTDGVSLRGDGTVYFGRVDFRNNGIDVYLDTVPTFSSPVLSIPGAVAADLIQLDGSGAAWMGITSATGFSVQRHELLSWTINACQPAIVGIESSGMPVVGREPTLRPSPSQDHAALQWLDAKSPGAIYVYDVTGARVWSKAVVDEELVSGIAIPANQFTNGLYVIHIITTDCVKTIPWIVQR